MHSGVSAVLSRLEILIQGGANWSLNCRDDVTIRDKIKEKMIVAEFKVIEQAAGNASYVSGQSIGSAVKQSLATMIEEADLKEDDGERHDVGEFEKALAAASLADLEAQSPSEIGLLQMAAEAGLHRHVCVLLQKGLNPNRFMEGTAPAVVVAAKRGNHEVLRVLKDGGGANFAVFDPRTRCSVLHSILRRIYGAEGMSLQYEAAEMQERYVKCLNLILGKEGKGGQDSSAFEGQMRGIINAKDILGNTALHYATQMWPHSVARRLLEGGANIRIKNKFGEVPDILPAIMEQES